MSEMDEVTRKHVASAESLYNLALFALRLVPAPFIVFVLFTGAGAMLGWNFGDDKVMVALIDVGIITGVLCLGTTVAVLLGKRAYANARQASREALRAQISDETHASDAPAHDPARDSSTNG